MRRMENEGTAPRILNLGNWCRRVLSALSTTGTDRIDCWGGPQGRSRLVPASITTLNGLSSTD